MYNTFETPITSLCTTKNSIKSFNKIRFIETTNYHENDLKTPAIAKSYTIETVSKAFLKSSSTKQQIITKTI